jgi:hypothetical protein
LSSLRFPGNFVHQSAQYQLVITTSYPEADGLGFDIMITRPAPEIWEAALGQLQLEVSKPNFSTWLRIPGKEPALAD